MQHTGANVEDCAIEWSANELLPEKKISEILNKVVKAISGRASAAYIFGSFARNQARRSSDLDLILIVDTDKQFLHRADDFYDLWEIASDLDLLVYTQSEFDALIGNPTEGFWKSVRLDLKRIL